VSLVGELLSFSRATSLDRGLFIVKQREIHIPAALGDGAGESNFFIFDELCMNLLA